jgi:hypothetical protein
MTPNYAIRRSALVADVGGRSMPQLLACGLCLLAVSRIASSAPTQSPVAVPIELLNNFPVLEVAIGDRRIPLMFDLGGSDEIVLSSDALRSLQVEYLDETYVWVDAKGNRLESRKFRVPELRIGSLVLRDVSGHEDAEAATYRKTPAGKGYIGAALVRPFRLVIDYERQTMIFIPADRSDAERHGCYGTAVPFDPEWDGEPITKASTDLGELVLVWDTGAPMSLIREGLVTKRGITPDSKFVRSTEFALGGKNFGPVQLRLFNFAEPAGVDGFVGHDFFAKHVVCIDMSGKRLFIRSNT